jgi:DNA-binding response OmpR family regulator
MPTCSSEGENPAGLVTLAIMEPIQTRILIVEDDHATRRFLADNLCADGYEPLEAPTAAAGRRLLGEAAPELAILDLGLPDRDGLALLAEIRQSATPATGIDPGLPVLIVSGRTASLDRIRGFERGCDDYLSKPFSYAELRWRLVSLLRRSGARRRSGRIRVGALELDPVTRAVAVAGEPLALSKKEYGLLLALARDPTRVFTREELLRDVWGFRFPVRTRTLDSHVSRVRRKLAARGQPLIVNVWGVGYRLVDGGPG